MQFKATDMLANQWKLIFYLIEILISAMDSKLHQFLVSPSQLQTKLLFIQKHIPFNSISLIEIPKLSLSNIYNLIKVKTYKERNIIVFEIEIPLAEREYYEIFKLTPIPVEIKDQVYSIVEIKPIVAVKNTSYMVLDNLNSCFQATNTFICQKPAVSYISSVHQSCEMQLFSGVSSTLCTTHFIHVERNMWIICDTENVIYIYDKPEVADAVCDNQHISLTIGGKGVLKVNKTTACEINTIGFKIYIHNMEKSVNSSVMMEVPGYVPERILSWKKDSVKSHDTPRVALPAILDTNTKLKDIGKEIKLLEQNQSENGNRGHWPPSMHDLTTYGIIAVIIVFLVASRYIKAKPGKRDNTSSSHIVISNNIPNGIDQCQREEMVNRDMENQPDTSSKW